MLLMTGERTLYILNYVKIQRSLGNTCIDKRKIILTMITYAIITFLLEKLNRYFTLSKPLFSCS